MVTNLVQAGDRGVNKTDTLLYLLTAPQTFYSWNLLFGVQGTIHLNSLPLSLSTPGSSLSIPHMPQLWTLTCLQFSDLLSIFPLLIPIPVSFSGVFKYLLYMLFPDFSSTPDLNVQLDSSEWVSGRHLKLTRFTPNFFYFQNHHHLLQSFHLLFSTSILLVTQTQKTKRIISTPLFRTQPQLVNNSSQLWSPIISRFWWLVLISLWLAIAISPRRLLQLGGACIFMQISWFLTQCSLWATGKRWVPGCTTRLPDRGSLGKGKDSKPVLKHSPHIIHLLLSLSRDLFKILRVVK